MKKLSQVAESLAESLFLAMAGFALSCATTTVVREWRAPRVLAVELDPSCHITDPIRVLVDGTAHPMPRRSPLELIVGAGPHTLSARVVTLDSAAAWEWDPFTTTVPDGQRHIDRLTC